MRPIDADALLSKWNEKAMKMVRDKDGAIPIDFSSVISALILEPTLDDLRPKGRWVCPDFEFSDYWKCSACGEEFYFEEHPNEVGCNFCPSCGAKMMNGEADE